MAKGFPFRIRRCARPLRSAVFVLAIGGAVAIALSACGGDSNEAAEDTAPSLRCTTPDGYTCLAVREPSGQLGLDVDRYSFPALATLRHDQVEVVLRGAAPAETVQLLSTFSLYDGTVHRADDDGEVAFTLEHSEAGEHTFIAVGELRDDRDTPAAWRFVSTVVDDPELDPGVVDRPAATPE